MAEWFPGTNPDFSSLAPEAPPPKPEKKSSDDEDDKKPSLFEAPPPPAKEETRGGEAAKSEEEKPKTFKEIFENLDKAEAEGEKDPIDESASPESLGDDEAALTLGATAEANVEALESQPPDAATLAEIAYNERVLEKTEDGATADEAIDESYDEVLQELEINDPDAEVPTQPPAEAPDELTPAEAEPPIDEPPTPPSGGSGAGSGGGGVPPPPPGGPLGPGTPNNPFGPGGPAGPGGPGNPNNPFGPGGPLNPNLPAGNTPNVTPNQATNPNQDPGRRRNNLPYVLAGGLVGYMVGRRRGRIKTEERLLPVQRKLETEVRSLQERLAARQEMLAAIVHQKVAETPAVADKITEKVDKLRAEKKEKAKPATNERRREHEPEVEEPRVERLGKVIVDNERAPVTAEAARPKSVELMTVPELLAIADKLSIEQSSSIKTLYETSRLSEEGLRRVIDAYLRGERYDQVLHENMTSPEALTSPERLGHLRGVSSDNLHGGQAGRQPLAGVAPLWVPDEAKPVDQELSVAQDKPPIDWIQMPGAQHKRPFIPTALGVIAVVIAILYVMFIIAR